MDAKTRYLVVEDTGGEVQTRAYWAYSLAEAMTVQDRVEKETGSSWLITVVVY